MSTSLGPSPTQRAAGLSFPDALRAVARELDPALPTDDAGAARRIAAAVVELSRGLTRNRALAGTRYLDDPRLGLAYLLYYLPATVRRTVAALAAAGPRLRRAATLRVLDLGCGPGTLLLGLLEVLTAGRGPGDPPITVDYLGVDHAPAPLRGLGSLAARLAPGLAASGVTLTARTRVARLLPAPPAETDPFDLVLVGNTLSELTEDLEAARSWLAPTWERLAPGGLMLVLEPGLAPVTALLCGLRDGLGLAPDATILSPCTHHGPCPLLGPDAPRRQWCHQEVAWTRPRLVQTVDDLTGLRKDRLTLSHLLLARSPRTGRPDPAGVYRAIGPTLRAKGRVTVHLCGAGGFREAELLTRHVSEANEAFTEVERGDGVTVTPPLPDAPRIRLDAGATVAVSRLLPRASAAGG